MMVHIYPFGHHLSGAFTQQRVCAWNYRQLSASRCTSRAQLSHTAPTISYELNFCVCVCVYRIIKNRNKIKTNFCFCHTDHNFYRHSSDETLLQKYILHGYRNKWRSIPCRGDNNPQKYGKTKFPTSSPQLWLART